MQPAIDFFESLLATRLPALAAHISSLGIPTDAYLVPWLLTLFARSLPLSTASRIWDRVLAEGEGETFRAAIALMQLLRASSGAEGLSALRFGRADTPQARTHAAAGAGPESF